MAKSTVPFFRLNGYVGDQPVSAEWRDGYLSADEELMDVADGLVQRGEEFGGNGTAPVKAGLEDPLAIVLTLAKSFDRITKTTIEISPDENERIQAMIESFGLTEG